MKTSSGAGAFLLGALVLGACVPFQGAEVRGPTTTASFDHYVPTQTALQRAKKSSRPDSPLVLACKSGSSRACNELGDRLTLKHAQSEALHWYMTSCERVRTAMVPNATRLMQLSRELRQLGSVRTDDARAHAANQKRLAELKSDASEIRARIQGCFDTGDTLKLEQDLKLALPYYDAVCEFSTLVEAVGETVQGFEHVTEIGCAEDRSARAKLTEAQFSPQLFVTLAEPERQPAVAKQSAAQTEAGMVFSEGDL